MADSQFPPEQRESIRTALLWATTLTTECRRLATFGGQLYSSSDIETKIIEGDRPVCFDKGFSISDASQRCIVYSFGIKNDWSFDDSMARFGCEVHAFDPSINIPEGQRPSGVRFHRVGIGRNNHINALGWKVQTLDSIMSDLGHTKQRLAYLKIDTEGAEFDMLAQQLLQHEQGKYVLDSFDQIGMEIHFRLDPEQQVGFYSLLLNITRGLQKRQWKMASSEPNKIYNKWFRFPGMKEPFSHMFDVLLLNRRLVSEVE